MDAGGVCRGGYPRWDAAALNSARWDAGAVRDALGRYVAFHLGDPAAVPAAATSPVTSGIKHLLGPLGRCGVITRPHSHGAPGAVVTVCGRLQHCRDISLSVPGTPRSAPHSSFIAATATAPPVVSGPAPGATTVRHDLQWAGFNETGPTDSRLDTKVSGPLPRAIRCGQN